METQIEIPEVGDFVTGTEGFASPTGFIKPNKSYKIQEVEHRLDGTYNFYIKEAGWWIFNSSCFKLHKKEKKKMELKVGDRIREVVPMMLEFGPAGTIYEILEVNERGEFRASFPRRSRTWWDWTPLQFELIPLVKDQPEVKVGDLVKQAHWDESSWYTVLRLLEGGRYIHVKFPPSKCSPEGGETTYPYYESESRLTWLVKPKFPGPKSATEVRVQSESFKKFVEENKLPEAPIEAPAKAAAKPALPSGAFRTWPGIHDKMLAAKLLNEVEG